MATEVAPPISAFPAEWSMADLHEHLGGISLGRIRVNPPPGTATEGHLLRVHAQTGRICELIDGTLVEKTMGYYESRLAVLIGHFIEAYLESRDLGIVLGEAGFLKIVGEQIRAADVAFLSWDHFPNRDLPGARVPQLAPDLAVEVLSKDNTPREMERKRREYFEAGVRLVWQIDPDAGTAEVYTSPAEFEAVAADGVLQGSDVLPGFELSLAELFAKAGRRRQE